jgi:hypothetical protein
LASSALWGVHPIYNPWELDDFLFVWFSFPEAGQPYADKNAKTHRVVTASGGSFTNPFEPRLSRQRAVGRQIRHGRIDIFSILITDCPK